MRRCLQLEAARSGDRGDQAALLGQRGAAGDRGDVEAHSYSLGRGARVREQGTRSGRRDAIPHLMRDHCLLAGPRTRIRRLEGQCRDEIRCMRRLLPSSPAPGAGYPCPSCSPCPSMPLPFWIAGRPATSEVVADVLNPYDGSVVGRHAVPTADQVEQAVAAAWSARHETAAPAGRRPRRGAHARLDQRHPARRGDRPTHHRRERQAADVGPGRDPPRGLDLPVGRRGGPPLQRRVPAAGHRPGRRRPRCTRAPVPDRAGPGDRPVQLPAEPDRAQGRAGDRGRCADHHQAGPVHPAVGAAAR